MRDVVIVGGGLAGLSAGWRTRHLDGLLLEKDQRVGGRIRSERRGPYWLNWGAHVFNGPNSGTGRLLDEVGVDAAPVPGNLTALAMNGTVLTRGRVETFPFRVPMPWSSRLAAVKAGLKVRLAVARYERVVRERSGEPLRVRQQRIYDYLGDVSFADFIGPLPEDARALVEPTVTRSGGRLDQVSAGAGIGYFHLVWDRHGGLGRNIVGGPSTLTGALGAALQDRIVREADVHTVELHHDHVTVSYTNGIEGDVTVAARHVIMATPAPVTRKVVTNLPGQLDDALAQIRYGPYVSAALLTDEKGPAPWDGCYAIATPKQPFNVLFNMSNLVRGTERQRQPGSSLMVFSPSDLARALIDRDDAEVIDTYVAHAGTIFPNLPRHIVEAEVQRWPLGLAYNFPGRGRIQAALTQPYGRLHVAGDYLGSLYTETAVRTGVDAGADVLSAITSGGGRGPSGGR